MQRENDRYSYPRRYIILKTGFPEELYNSKTEKNY